MAEIHPGRREVSAECPFCGADIIYTVAEGAGGGDANGSINCPSCGRAVDSEGTDPKLDQFGPGLGQSGA
jgi:predicted RNA-binding Zn-ribbon protein involved in translation (DUF1610 family)